MFLTFYESFYEWIWAPSRENLSSGLSTRWDSNRPAQLQKLARALKFRIWKLEAVCAGWSAPLLFVYGKNRFSHDGAHISSRENNEQNKIWYTSQRNHHLYHRCHSNATSDGALKVILVHIRWFQCMSGDRQIFSCWDDILFWCVEARKIINHSQEQDYENV